MFFKSAPEMRCVTMKFPKGKTVLTLPTVTGHGGAVKEGQNSSVLEQVRAARIPPALKTAKSAPVLLRKISVTRFPIWLSHVRPLDEPHESACLKKTEEFATVTLLVTFFAS